MKKKFAMFFVLLILVSACGPGVLASTSNDSTPAPKKATATAALTLMKIELPAGYGVSGPWFELYFTNPKSPLAPQLTGGPDGPLAAAIDAARLSVDLAIYSLSLNSIRDALLRAHDRGVRVRLV